MSFANFQGHHGLILRRNGRGRIEQDRRSQSWRLGFATQFDNASFWIRRELGRRRLRGRGAQG